MASQRLLSILTCNRNDNYSAYAVERTRFVINYFSYVAKKLGLSNAFEYILVDWGSATPFSSFFISELKDDEFFGFVKFINVPASYTQKFDLDFDTSQALNIGLKYSSGEHVMVLSSDQFLPLSIFNNLMSLLSNPEKYGLSGDEYKLVPRKILESNFNFLQQNMQEADNFLTSINQSMNPYRDHKVNVGSGGGGLMLKKRQWIEIGGFKETIGHNRGQDPMVMLQTSKFLRHIDAATFGVFLLKLPRTISGSRLSQVTRAKFVPTYDPPRKGSVISEQEEIVLVDHMAAKKLSCHLPGEDANSADAEEKYQATVVGNSVSAALDLTSLLSLVGASAKSADFAVAEELERLIRRRRISSVVFDMLQAARFALYIGRRFPDITIHVLLAETTTILSGNALVRDRILRVAMRGGHYGYLKALKRSDASYGFISPKVPHIFILDEEETLDYELILTEHKSKSTFAIRHTMADRNTAVSYYISSANEKRRLKVGFSRNLYFNTLILVMGSLRAFKRQFFSNLKERL